jgi:hypothetical protein
MASTYSTNLAIELIGTGDQAGSWGNTTNTNLGTLIEQAISGYVTQAVSTGTDTTITIPNGATGVARNMYIELTGTGGASTNLIVPANKKLYFIFNNTSSGQVTVKVSGQTGVSVPNGKKMVLVSNGTDVVVAENYIADFGSNSATITNLTCTSLTLSNNPTFSGGTANGVLYLNGSKVATSGATFAFDSSDRLIVGAGSAVFGARIECVANTSGDGLRIRGRASDATGILSFGANAAATEYARIQSDNTSALIFGTGASGTERMRLTSSVLSTDSSISVGIGTASPASKLDTAGTIRATSQTVPSSGTGAELFYDATNAGLRGYNRTGSAYVNLALNDNVYIGGGSSGNLGIGTASPGAKLHVLGSNLVGIFAGTNANTIYTEYRYNSTTVSGYIGNGSSILSAAADSDFIVRSEGALKFATNGNNFRAVIDSSGNLGIGTTSPAAKLNVDAGSAGLMSVFDSTNANGGYLLGRSSGTAVWDLGTAKQALNVGGATDFGINVRSGFMAFGTNNTERARITSGGDFLVGQTTNALADTGHILDGDGLAYHITNGLTCLTVNRKTSDGTLVDFLQDGTSEGTISVSGNTVSYNAFAGSHWSQLQDGSKPDILRGTVMESINELCVWPGEQNERLPKSKVSDTAGSKKVYGVFMAWDNDWTTTNDMYITAVGAFICRVNGSVTVQEGDLLESNGDGTARVQADDIIRSSTIGKVTSTVKTHQYDDGSYCVPTVLYCG